MITTNSILNYIRKIVYILAIYFVNSMNAQVGVGIINPQGIFHIDGGKDTPLSGVPTAAQEINDFIILGDGKVGMGIITPQKSLDINANNDAIRARNLRILSNWPAGGTEILVRDLTTGNINGVTYIYSQSLSVAAGASGSFTVPLDTAFENALLTLTSGNACGRDMIASFNVKNRSLNFLGGIGRDKVGQAAITPIPGNGTGSATWTVTFPSVIGCADGGGGTQFDFTLVKTNDTTYQITNNGNVARTYVFTLVRT